jgi:plastocyanin domain-containing protein
LKQSIALLALALGMSMANAAATEVKRQDIDLKVTEKGFEPNQIDVKPGTNVTLKVTRTTDSTCATAIRIPSKKMSKELPLNKTIIMELGKLDKGEIRFACGMDMVSGQIFVH